MIKMIINDSFGLNLKANIYIKFITNINIVIFYIIYLQD